jgi:hypothetical protein
MQIIHPAQAESFKGGKSWRRRFVMRFRIGLRRKTNAKNETWADTEPILLRYSPLSVGGSSWMTIVATPLQ